ncbi:hypothetical protein J6590_099051 [Homalodisca vitripennis]|nr:hypothetical protein J6590_099051 [Homalodisca vitripennis]
MLAFNKMWLKDTTSNLRVSLQWLAAESAGLVDLCSRDSRCKQSNHTSVTFV